MGISANQFWATSTNGKAMIVLLAQRGDVETCKDVCEWLVDQRELGLRQDFEANGASKEAAKLRAADAVAGVRKVAESINDRNVIACVENVVDNIFQRFYQQGPKHYAAVMATLANQLRQKIVD